MRESKKQAAQRSWCVGAPQAIIRSFVVVEKENNHEVITVCGCHGTISSNDTYVAAYESIMAEKHFFEQRKHGESYLIPFLERNCPNFRDLRILDVGCAEAGFLDALHAEGIPGMGLELQADRIALSTSFNPELHILEGDITDPGIVAKIGKKFDLIVIRDVIEHIPDKDTVFKHLNALLNEDGFIYITFPPRYSPFGGHQQNGRSILRAIPYIHLLPSLMIRVFGKVAGEHAHVVESIITLRRIGLTIREFEKLSALHGYRIHRKDLFLFRPVFRVRHGLRTVRLPDLPAVRELLVLGCECLLQKRPAEAAMERPSVFGALFL